MGLPMCRLITRSLVYGSRARSSASQVTKVIEHTVLAPTCKIDLVQNKTECKFVVVQLKMFFTEEYFHRKSLPEIKVNKERQQKKTKKRQKKKTKKGQKKKDTKKRNLLGCA